MADRGGELSHAVARPRAANWRDSVHSLPMCPPPPRLRRGSPKRLRREGGQDAESHGGEHRRRPAKKAPAAIIGFPCHVIALRHPLAKDDDVHRFA